MNQHTRLDVPVGAVGVRPRKRLAVEEVTAVVEGVTSSPPVGEGSWDAEAELGQSLLSAPGEFPVVEVSEPLYEQLALVLGVLPVILVPPHARWAQEVSVSWVTQGHRHVLQVPVAYWVVESAVDPASLLAAEAFRVWEVEGLARVKFGVVVGEALASP